MPDRPPNPLLSLDPPPLAHKHTPPPRKPPWQAAHLSLAFPSPLLPHPFPNSCSRYIACTTLPPSSLAHPSHFACLHPSRSRQPTDQHQTTCRLATSPCTPLALHPLMLPVPPFSRRRAAPAVPRRLPTAHHLPRTPASLSPRPVGAPPSSCTMLFAARHRTPFHPRAHISCRPSP